MKNQPDYEYLLKLESWSKKDAALIICGFDPLGYRSVRFTQSNIPDQLTEVYKLYQIFRSVDFGRKYHDHNKQPLNYLSECKEKDIPINEVLHAAAQKRLEHMQRINSEMNSKADEKEAAYVESGEGARERNYLLKIIGVLANLYFSKNESQQLASKKVVSHLVEDSLQFLEDHSLKSPGLGKSNLHKKITEGMRILIDEQP